MIYGPDKLFVEKIRDELIAEGHTVHEQVPCGGQFIDLMTDAAIYIHGCRAGLVAAFLGG